MLKLLKQVQDSKALFCESYVKILKSGFRGGVGFCNFKHAFLVRSQWCTLIPGRMQESIQTKWPENSCSNCWRRIHRLLKLTWTLRKKYVTCWKMLLRQPSALWWLVALALAKVPSAGFSMAVWKRDPNVRGKTAWSSINFKLGHTSFDSETEVNPNWNFAIGVELMQRFPIIIMDTPGLGDSRGEQKDEKHLRTIAGWVNGLSHVHLVILLVTPETRMT